MIKSFGNKAAQDLAAGKTATRHARLLPRQHHQRAVDLFELMEASISVSDFKLPASNRLHKLDGDVKGFWSITVRDGWRIIFRFDNAYYWDVQVLDYH
jgi:proteic killer suppression protein